MPKPLWFAFYPGVWLTDASVLTMSLAQQGAYVRLLCLAACNDGIPEDPRPLIGDPALWAAPLTDCWVEHPDRPGYLHNRRLLHEIDKADAKRAAGRKAVNSRSDRKLQRPYNGRSTTDVQVEKSRERGTAGLQPVGKLLPRSLREREATAVPTEAGQR